MFFIYVIGAFIALIIIGTVFSLIRDRKQFKYHEVGRRQCRMCGQEHVSHTSVYRDHINDYPFTVTIWKLTGNVVKSDCKCHNYI